MTRRAGSGWLAALTIALSGLTGACDSDSDGGDGDLPPTVEQARSQLSREAAPPVSAGDRLALADGNAAFAMALYHQVEAENPNLVLSPISISTALAMTFAGARGQTETEMAAALRFTLPQARLHPAMNELTAALGARGEGKQGADGQPFRLNIVNTTWAQKDFAFLPGYLDALAVSYWAGVNLLDFRAAPEPSRLTINRWVAAQTEQRIKDLLPLGSIDDHTRLVLTNAVYFNAAWKSPFIRKTEDAPFKRADGSTVQVPMMSHKDQFRAGVIPGLARAVALPYDDDRLSMLVVLPDPGQLAALESQLGTAGLAAFDAALVDQVVVLGMPRFKFETPLGLNDALKALGMPLAFDKQRADFTGISAVPLYIAAVLHKAFIAVAEKGTEAAAATAVVIGEPVSAPLQPPLSIYADRPFLFFIRDDASKAILFMGRVSDPSR
jgi:serpin B